jgi:predicted Zn-dependent protease
MDDLSLSGVPAPRRQPDDGRHATRGHRVQNLAARATAFALLAALTATVVAEIVAPYVDGASAKPLSEEEQRVWSQSKELDEMIHKSGIVYEDAELTGYVRGVMRRLFPEFEGRMQVTLLKSPDLNAFAVPDGHVYVNVGLMARFQNEAQLATVLAHEGSHFTHRHGYRSQNSLKSNSALATIGAMMGIVGLIPAMLATSSVFGFSRELETEADQAGFQRLSRAGYDVREAPRAFEHLMVQVKALDSKEPYFFATHPKLKDRFDNLSRMAAKSPGGQDGASREDYSQVMLKARMDTLQNELSMGRYKSALVVLEKPENLALLPPETPYLLGEAYRLRGEAGDLDRADAAYRKAMAAAPEFAPSYRALGFISLKRNQYDEARRFFIRYLDMAPDASDRKYVESYLRMIEKKGAQP